MSRLSSGAPLRQPDQHPFAGPREWGGGSCEHADESFPLSLIQVPVELFALSRLAAFVGVAFSVVDFVELSPEPFDINYSHCRPVRIGPMVEAAVMEGGKQGLPEH